MGGGAPSIVFIFVSFLLKECEDGVISNRRRFIQEEYVLLDGFEGDLWLVDKGFMVRD